MLIDHRKDRKKTDSNQIIVCRQTVVRLLLWIINNFACRMGCISGMQKKTCLLENKQTGLLTNQNKLNISFFSLSNHLPYASMLA